MARSACEAGHQRRNRRKAAARGCGHAPRAGASESARCVRERIACEAGRVAAALRAWRWEHSHAADPAHESSRDRVPRASSTALSPLGPPELARCRPAAERVDAPSTRVSHARTHAPQRGGPSGAAAARCADAQGLSAAQQARAAAHHRVRRAHAARGRAQRAVRALAKACAAAAARHAAGPPGSPARVAPARRDHHGPGVSGCAGKHRAACGGAAGASASPAGGGCRCAAA
jgi:hypothetical protein